MASPDIVIRLIGDATDLQRKFGNADKGISKIGLNLTKTLTPAALAVGAGFRHAFQEFDTGADALRVGSGKTGKALKELEGSAKNVAGKVTQGFGEVGTVMAELSKRTELTGKPLENMTRKVLNLSKATGIDAVASIGPLTRLFGDWSIATDKQSGTLDKLFRAGQASGVSVDRLSELMVQFGSPLRQLGLDFDTSAAMFARFEREGVNIQTAMPGLRMALKNFAKDGREPGPALLDTIEKIKNTASVAKANTMAFEVFGTRAGPDLAAAIREGRFELDDYIDAMKNGSDSADKAVKDTLDWSDKLAMLKNRIIGVVGPIGEVGMGAAGVAAGIGPALVALPKLGGAFKAVGSAAKFLFASPIGLAILAVVVATVLIIKHWDKVKGFLLAAWGFITAAARVAFGALKTFVMVLLLGPAVLIIKHWDKVKAAASRIWGAIKGFFGGVLGVLKAWFLNFTGVGLIIKHWDKVKAAASRIWNGIRSFFGKALDGIKTAFLNFTPVGQIIKHWDTIVGFVKGLPGKIARAASGMWNGIKDAFRGSINWIIDAWNRLQFKIPGFDPPGPGPKFNGFTLGLPDIPRLHSGGIFRAPTSGGEGLALLKDRERVIPAGDGDRLQAAILAELRRLNANLMSRPVVLEADKRQLARVVDDALRNRRGERA